ncbi:hypothetical protein JCM3766R1_001601 [Sporobolomyces carnicolor]
MDQDALRVLAENRAQSDTKQLKKAMKEFYALLKPTLPHDQLEAMHTSFSITLSQLSTHLTKSSRIQQTTAFEVAQYRQEQAEIDQQSLSTRQRIQELAQQLERAKEERSRRIEYDSLTKVINRLPDREKGLESQEKLQKDIDLLKQEEKTYSETWNTRKLAFDAIVSSLEVMQEAIRDEKAEQERRRALDDAEDDEEGAAVPGDGTNPPLDPNAAPFVPGGTGSTEPNAAETADEDAEMAEAVTGEERVTTEVETTEATRPGADDREEGEESIEEGEMDTDRA